MREKGEMRARWNVDLEPCAASFLRACFGAEEAENVAGGLSFTIYQTKNC